MKTIVPNYYFRFHCTAGKCNHNCCREGWEILLDDETAKLYGSLREREGCSISEQIRNGVVLPGAKERKNGVRPGIRLGPDGVCPFLNEQSLCELILAYGDKGICQVCRDHPRFRNYYKGRVELGIGFCCEEAVRLILSETVPVRYADLEKGNEEIPFFKKAGAEESVRKLNSAPFDFEKWVSLLCELEQLEKDWKELLRYAAGKEDTESCYRKAEDRRYEAILEYFMFRHYCTAGPAFVSFCYRLILEIHQRTGADLAEICRLFSTEIEYSDINTDKIIQKLKSEEYCG